MISRILYPPARARWLSRFNPPACWLGCTLLPAFLGAAPAPALSQPVEIQFLDSATGRSIQPGRISARTGGSEASGMSADSVEADSTGRVFLNLPPGRHTLLVDDPAYGPVSAEVNVGDGSPYRLRFLLDPVEEPAEIRPENLAARRRPDAMLLQGFVVDDATGVPVTDVDVAFSPGSARGSTDERGYFSLYAPVTEYEASTTVGASSLRFERAGYRTVRRENLELWPGGDWTYRIRLQRGEGEDVIDESASRRRAPEGSPQVPVPPVPEPDPAPLVPEPQIQLATAPSNATVRVPRNIRVLRSDNVTIDYVSLTYYSRCVLPSEWIASWGSYAGGSNSLNAGAVASRCYAIARINNATSTSSYDICATTSCQVYDPSKIYSLTDVAVNYTANWVLLAGTAVASTEYSAENNSAGFSCGDGFTQPTGGCVYDPVCAGETRFGHGRGMCQWGTARWATGRRMAGRVSGDSTPNGYPRRDWMWIVRHYYPALTLVKGAPLVVGDDVKALKSLDVRACPGGSISNGTACALVTTKAAGATGVIIGGPTTVTADGRGFTWYQVRWNDASSSTGWAAENYLDRVVSAPAVPTALSATGVSTNQINLAWADNSDIESGFRLERAPSGSGPWAPLVELPPNTASYADRGLLPGQLWHYRVSAYNAAGASAPSGIASGSALGLPPAIAPIADRTVHAGQSVVVPVTATAADRIRLIADFESFPSETANGLVLFRTPSFSGSTSGFINAAPNLAAVSDTFPVDGHGTGLILRVTCEFTNPASPWLRLTTADTLNFPNPVIDLRGGLRFDIRADKPIRLAVGCRETSTPAGTPIGANGGSGGPIEWVGASGKSGTAPVPTRVIPANTWTTLAFDFPNEPVVAFTGDGVLSTASGLGVLEHLAVVPGGGTGVYNLYFDNFTAFSRRALTFSLGPGAPAGASIHGASGVFTWATPGPGIFPVPVVVSDDSAPPLGATNTFNVVVAPPPAIDRVTTAASGIALSWSAIPGTTYRVQFKEDLNQAGWTDLQPLVTAAAAAASFTNTTTAAEQGYYRVVVAP